MKLLILNLISTCLFTPCIAQLSKPVTVTYEFIKVSTNLINSRPVNIQLTTDDISYYFRQDYHNRDKISKTDSLILVEMITNKSQDTTSWKIQEIPNVYIVRNNKIRYKNSAKYQKEKDSINYLLKDKLNQPCNYGNLSKEIVYSVSKPIFNKTNTLALVQYEILNCKNEGYIYVRLYKLNNELWTEVDVLLSLKRETTCFAPTRIK